MDDPLGLIEYQARYSHGRQVDAAPRDTLPPLARCRGRFPPRQKFSGRRPQHLYPAFDDLDEAEGCGRGLDETGADLEETDARQVPHLPLHNIRTLEASRLAKKLGGSET